MSLKINEVRMLMTNEEMEITVQRACFWEEVLKISKPRYRKQIIDQELAAEVERLGGAILFILKDYADKNRGKSPI